MAGTEPVPRARGGVPLYAWMTMLLLAVLAVSYWRYASATKKTTGDDQDDDDQQQDQGPAGDFSAVSSPLFATNASGTAAGQAVPPSMTNPSWPTAANSDQESSS